MAGVGGQFQPAVRGWAIASAALSPVVMIGGWLVAEALQPPSYSPVRSSISGLAGLGANRPLDHDERPDPGGSVLFRDRRGPARRPGAGPDRADGRGPVQHRHRGVAGAGPRLDSAAPRLDLARRGRDHGMAGLHRPPGPVAAADPAGSAARPP